MAAGCAAQGLNMAQPPNRPSCTCTTVKCQLYVVNANTQQAIVAKLRPLITTVALGKHTLIRLASD